MFLSQTKFFILFRVPSSSYHIVGMTRVTFRETCLLKTVEKNTKYFRFTINNIIYDFKCGAYIILTNYYSKKKRKAIKHLRKHTYTHTCRLYGQRPGNVCTYSGEAGTYRTCRFLGLRVIFQMIIIGE